MRFTALFPPPPTPITLIFTPHSRLSSCSKVMFFSSRTSAFPIPRFWSGMFLRLFRITQGVAESTHIISYYFFALFSSLFSIFFLKFPLFFYFSSHRLDFHRYSVSFSVKTRKKPREKGKNHPLFFCAAPPQKSPSQTDKNFPAESRHHKKQNKSALCKRRDSVGKFGESRRGLGRKRTPSERGFSSSPRS